MTWSNKSITSLDNNSVSFLDFLLYFLVDAVDVVVVVDTYTQPPRFRNTVWAFEIDDYY